MELPAKGSVVVVLVPTSNRGASKARPALVLSSQPLGPTKSDFLVAVITTQETDPLRIAIEAGDLTSGTLDSKSFVRPLAIYPVSVSGLGEYIGAASPELIKRVTDAIMSILNG
jgi:mRNA-degrading endonuclease toxin of MazEF toxin-antitoxin module